MDFLVYPKAVIRCLHCKNDLLTSKNYSHEKVGKFIRSIRFHR